MTGTLQSIEMPEELLEQAMRRAGTSSPAAAVNEALREYVRSQTRDDLIGKSETFMTLEEFMEMRKSDE